MEPLYGAAFRRSAGLDAREAMRSGEQRAWWAAALTATLGLDQQHVPRIGAAIG
jgi:hypothetical protein